MSKNKKELIYRSAKVERAHIDEDQREIRLSFSSEEPYARYSMEHGDYMEVLGHRDGEIELDFIGSGTAPLLLDHDHKNQIGVVKTVEVSDGRGEALVKVSRSAAATEIWNDVLDGIRSNVSVGYYVTKQQVEEEKRDGTKVVRATSWKPIEVSLVSIPADKTVGVGRAEEEMVETAEKSLIEKKEDKTMTDKNEKPEVKIDIEAVRKEAAQTEQARVREISALGSKFGMTAEADEFIKNSKDAGEFRSFVLENMDVAAQNAPKAEVRNDTSIGMSEKEIKQYSIVRALRAIANPNDARAQREAAYEKEVSEAAQQREGRDAQGILVPHDVLTRDLTAGGANAGADYVATDLMAGSFIDLLRNKLLVAQLGATTMSGLRGNVAIPRQTGAATAYWIATEGADITAESTQATDQVTLTPRTLGAYTDYSRQMLNQSSVDVESFVRNDLARVLAQEVDRAAFYGSGATGQPSGIATQVTRLGAAAGPEFAAAVPTFAELIALETAVATANADFGNLAYVTDPSTRGGLKSTSKAGTEAIFVWENNAVNGYNAMVSNQITAGDVFFGNFADLIVASWGGLDLMADPYSLSTSGNVRIVALQDTDIAIRHLESFSWNNDTA